VNMMAKLRDTKINVVCPWCNMKGGSIAIVDAGYIKHYFHEKCDRQHKSWLRKRGQTRDDWIYHGKLHTDR
jgi:hypothetical protein